MQLELGKTYIAKNGDEITIVEYDSDELYPFYDEEGNSYTSNGRLYRKIVTEYDLIHEKENSTNPKDLIGIKKPSLSNIPSSALIYQAQAHKHGHEKYGFYNWRENKVQALIYIDAALRHLRCYLDREDHAKDSGVHHLAHVAANCNILLDAIETGKLIDNRPPKGNAAELLERFTSC